MSSLTMSRLFTIVSFLASFQGCAGAQQAGDLDGTAMCFLKAGLYEQAVKALSSPTTQQSTDFHTSMRHCDRLGLLRYLTSIHPQSTKQVQRGKTSLVKLSRQCGTSMTSAGAAGKHYIHSNHSIKPHIVTGCT